ncbi:MAG: DUF5671 domain-containing protein [Candidatus Pacebacteria bacterium]|nr:DUF5671 domain-containing protein [Candidatus Paceibacterota bacterium]MCF7857049.1 DUF5671 domain-containing protein [Candidatus Paceibacterota bacterium]
MENTAKNFVLQLGSLVTLYISVIALITLLFGIISVLYPDPAQGYYDLESSTSSIRFSIALLVVFFPVYLYFTRVVNVIRRGADGMYLALTKWLIYLSLLIGGLIILGDLVAIINSFLNGELTIRFILKALTFLIVVGAAFLYYLLDARGYWQSHERQSIQYGIGVSVVVAIVLVAGFLHIETPAQVREMKIDEQQINDLIMIQLRIEDYVRTKNALPEAIASTFSGVKPPQPAPERGSYSYEVTSDDSFNLCATFVYPSSLNDHQYRYVEPMQYDGKSFVNNSNWDHGVGEWCFERQITEIQK